MSEEVEHMATVTRLHSGSISVELLPGQNCQGCGIAALCRPKGEKKMVLNLKVDGSSTFSVGERVRLVANERSTWRAIWVGLVLPCILMCAAVTGSLAAGIDQTLSAWGGVAVIAIYYVILYIFRKRLVDRLSWTIEKLDRR